MKTKKLLTLVIVLTVAAGAVAFGFGVNADDETPKSRIPEYVLYDKLFRMVDSLKKKAEAAREIDAEKADALANYFKSRANLNDEENQILQNTALEFTRDCAPLDERAGVVITEARRNLLNNAGGGGEQTPPAELIDLQEQRNALALRYRDRLRESLGAHGYARFDEFVQGDFASGFEKIPLSAVNFAQPR